MWLNGARFTFNMRGKQTIEALRARLAEEAGYKKSQKFVWHYGTNTPEGDVIPISEVGRKTLKELGIINGINITATVPQEQNNDDDEEDGEEDHPVRVRAESLVNDDSKGLSLRYMLIYVNLQLFV